ncbi:hypothetical protein TorRG33x02_311600 [Trema orientale]|uniref:Uncharacterized protein n=1 Tax=Trema orientale TaxID=63057 RepID=A0A2P5BRG5_TREOI|nr:hypothetical protein TorRG33x02_311600 [Trema orientale]
MNSSCETLRNMLVLIEHGDRVCRLAGGIGSMTPSGKEIKGNSFLFRPRKSNEEEEEKTTRRSNSMQNVVFHIYL